MSVTTTSADAVKALRDRTGAGMMDCKAALQASAGDLEKAIDFLRKKGMASAAKRAGREAKEGLVASRVDARKAAIVEVNCETDFVARTDDFKGLVALALDETFASGNAAASSPKVTGQVEALSGKIGEKILVRRTHLMQTTDASLFTYVHSNNKLGVIVEIALAGTAGGNDAAFQEFGKNIAMQIAASNPLAVTRAEVPASVIERERAIFKEEIKGKPENIAAKIIEGKLNKFYQTTVLLEQPFIKDDKQSVQQLTDQVSKKIGHAVVIRKFTRFQLGESI